MTVLPGRWCPPPSPPLLSHLSPESCTGIPCYCWRRLGTAWLRRARLDPLGCNLGAPSHRRGCCLNQNPSLTDSRRPHRGQAPSGGLPLRRPSSKGLRWRLALWWHLTEWKCESKPGEAKSCCACAEAAVAPRPKVRQSGIRWLCGDKWISPAERSARLNEAQAASE